MSSMADFSLAGRVAIVTGGAGLLGVRHAEAIAAAGGVPVLADIRGEAAENKAAGIAKASGVPAIGVGCPRSRHRDRRSRGSSVSRRTSGTPILPWD